MTTEVVNDKEQMELEKKIYEALKAPFEMIAYGVDSSRGFDLASLKAQYIPDRLNTVLGMSNWHFDGNFEKDEHGVLFHGRLVVSVGKRVKEVKSVGYADFKKNLGDTYKSAMTDALSKAASHVGVADEAFKGLVDPKMIKSTNSIAPVAKRATEAIKKSEEVQKKVEPKVTTEDPNTQVKKPTFLKKKVAEPVVEKQEQNSEWE